MHPENPYAKGSPPGLEGVLPGGGFVLPAGPSDGRFGARAGTMTFSDRDRILADEQAIASGVAGRYATALFELAREKGELEDVDADLRHLDALLEESPEVRYATRSPALSRAEQASLMASLAEHLGLVGLVANFLGVLAKNRRLGELDEIATVFSRLVAAHKGEVRAEVISAKALDDAQSEALKAKLKELAGREVTIDARVDEGLIGGLIVRIGSRMIDGSVATKLASLERAMKGV